MSAQSRRELLLALRPEYLNASRTEKKKLLDGLVTATDDAKFITGGAFTIDGGEFIS